MRMDTAGLKYRSCTQHEATVATKATAARCTRSLIAENHRQTVSHTGECLVQGGQALYRRALCRKDVTRWTAACADAPVTRSGQCLVYR